MANRRIDEDDLRMMLHTMRNNTSSDESKPRGLPITFMLYVAGFAILLLALGLYMNNYTTDPTPVQRQQPIAPQSNLPANQVAPARYQQPASANVEQYTPPQQYSPPPQIPSYQEAPADLIHQHQMMQQQMPEQMQQQAGAPPPPATPYEADMQKFNQQMNDLQNLKGLGGPTGLEGIVKPGEPGSELLNPPSATPPAQAASQPQQASPQAAQASSPARTSPRTGGNRGY